jgi:hypothetical protein
MYDRFPKETRGKTGADTSTTCGFVGHVRRQGRSVDPLFRPNDQEFGVLRPDVFGVFRGNSFIGDHDAEILHRRKTAGRYLAKFCGIQKQNSLDARLHERLF